MNMLELVGVLRDIDAVKGKVCEACCFYSYNGCRKGHAPLDETDGCDDWRAAGPRQVVVRSKS